MNKWDIITDKGMKFELIQTGMAFKMSKKGEKPINPFFCDSNIAEALFNDESEFLQNLGNVTLTTENGIKIKIQAV